MKSPSLQIGSFTFNWGSRTYVMGILNVTPDSFSGDGIISKGDAVDVAVEQARDFLSSGADILDVGGESTRPGSAPVNADDEIERVIPIIHALHKNFSKAIISFQRATPTMSTRTLTEIVSVHIIVFYYTDEYKLSEYSMFLY